MTKRILILCVAALLGAVSTGTALAKTTVLLPGGTYLNQASASGLSCLGGASGASGTTTFVVSIPAGQSGTHVTFRVDYAFDPADSTLASYSGSATLQADAASTTQAVPVSIPVTGDDGLHANVINARVISITADGSLLFDSTTLGSWACGSTPTAQSGGTTSSSGSATGCAGIQQLVTETAGVKGELQHKAQESLKECTKGHNAEAARRLGDFLKELSRQASKLNPDLVSRWSELATSIRASLLA